MIEVLEKYPNFFPELKRIPILKYYREKFEEQNYKKIEEIDYQRCVMCVDCSVYPLAWIWYLAILQFLDLNHWIKGLVYFQLRKTLKGEDFIPPYEVVGSWGRMITLYLEYKKELKHE